MMIEACFYIVVGLSLMIPTLHHSLRERFS